MVPGSPHIAHGYATHTESTQQLQNQAAKWRFHHTKLGAYTIPSSPAQWTTNPTPYQAQHNTPTNTWQPTPHRHTTCLPRTLCMSRKEHSARSTWHITKTKPPHDSSHTTSSSNNNKPRQMICSKAHQGDANKTPKWIITQKDQNHPVSPLPTSTVPELALLRANYLRK
jgi:hypothetical protein